MKMSKFKFKKDQTVRILHNNTEGKVVRSWDEGNGYEYLIKHVDPAHGITNTPFTESELKDVDVPVFKRAVIYLTILIFVINAIIWIYY